MKTRIFNKLLAMQSFTLSVMLSLVMVATFSFSVSAQTSAPSVSLIAAASSVPAVDAASSVPAVDAASSVPAVDAASSVPAVNAASSFPAAATPRIRTSFDHLRTGFALTGVHISVMCETCHVGGTFKGTPKTCAGCHTQGARITALPKNQDHIPTNKACEACHLSTSSFRTFVMDHTGMTQPCSVCHSGSFALVKSPSPTHIPISSIGSGTAVACDVCHTNTFSFLGAKPSHTVYLSLGDCNTCHIDGNVSSPKGKLANHTTTNLPCYICHSATVTPGWPFPTSFLGASIDHRDVSQTNCASCHDGSGATATVKSASHIPYKAGLDCSKCHSPQVTHGWPYPNNFLGAPFDHNANGSTIDTHTCASCHGASAGVKAKSAAHITVKAATASFNCDSCHNTTSTFTGWTMDHKANGNDLTGCVNCHKASGDTTVDSAVVKGKPANHISTAAACESCHTQTSPGGFSTWAMNHNGIINNCASCHSAKGDTTISGSITFTIKGAPATHIKNTPVCENCHTNTSTGGFTVWNMDHTAVTPTLSCATCHDTTSPSLPSLVRKPANGAPGNTDPSKHIPYTPSVDCASCHKNTTSFTNWSASDVHNNSGMACTDCHSPTGAAFFDVSIVTYPAIHDTYTPVATSSTNCAGCHNTTTFLGATNGHDTSAAGVAAATGNCASCHNAGGTGKMFTTGVHIPSGTPTAKGAAGQCDVCHSNGFKTFSFAGATISHTPGTAYPVGTTCTVCHSGTYAATEGVKSLPSGNSHIAIPSGTDCSACHSTSNFTGWVTSDVHTAVGASATSTTTKCDSCHGSGKSFVGTTIKNLPAQPAAHINFNTGTDCVACHNSLSSFTSWNMGSTGHTAANASACSSCHDTTATVPAGVVLKPATGTGSSSHIAYNSGTECDACHGKGYSNFTNWTMGSSSHANVSATSCASCHSPTGATFKNVSLVTYPVNHNNFSPSATSASDCSTCHTTTSFLGATNGHDISSAGIAKAANNCASCHKAGGNGLMFDSAKHIPSGTPLNKGDAGQCDTCHTSGYQTFSFTGAVISHTPGTAYPNGTTCTVCHSGTYAATEGVKSLPSGNSHIAIPSGTDCSACHSTSNFTGWVTSDVHTAVGASATSTTTKCDTCHGSGKSFVGTTIKNLPAQPAAHINFNASVDCVACHNSLSSFTSWVMGATGHTAANAGSCASCHDTAASVPASVVKKPATGTNGHIAYNSGTDCASCHTAGFSSFTNWSMGTTGHSFVTASSCSSCHTNGASFYNASLVTFIDHSTYTPAPAPTNTSDCSSCHNTTSFFGSTGGHDSTPAGIQAAKNNCASCHKAGGTGKMFTTGVHIPSGTPTANGAAGQCDVCHTTSYSTFTFTGAVISHTPGTAYPSGTTCTVCHSGTYAATEGVKSLPSGNSHIAIPSGTDCSACHSTSNFTGWVTSDVHTAVGASATSTTTKCDTCHGSGKSFVGTTIKNLPAQPAAHINFNASVDCVACHNSLSSFTSWTMGATGHTAANAGSCASCHDTAASVPASVVKKPATGTNGHIAYNSGTDCASCHTAGFSSFTNWSMGTTGHSFVTASSCSSCHTNGASFYNASLVTFIDHSTYTPAPAPTNTSDCSSCHNTTSFFGSTGGHDSTPAGIQSAKNNCASCHNAGGTGKMFTTGVHIPSGTPTAKGDAGQCDVCHTTSYSTFTFTGAVISHTPGTAYPNGTTCTVCHSGTYAATEGVKSLPNGNPGHIAIPGGKDCSACHSTSNFTGWVTSDVHTAVGAGATSTTTKCDSCHGSGKLFVGTTIKNLPAQPAAHINFNASVDCVACHNSLSSFTSWTMGATGHAAANAGSCASCHDTAASVPASVVKKPATGTNGHIAFNTNTTCDSCHGTGYSSFGTWLMGTTGHSLVSASSCSSCHTDTAKFYNVSLVTFVNHSTFTTPVPSNTSDCSQCHSTTTFADSTSGHDQTANGIAANTNNCTSCHKAGGTGKMFTDGVHIPSGKPTAKGAAGQCDYCHTAGYSTFSFAGATMNHTSGYVSGTRCDACHIPAFASEGVKSTAATTHISIPSGSDCAACHKTTTSFTGWLTSDVHTAVNAGTSPYTCASCHDSSKSYTAVVIKPSAATAHISYNAGVDCSVCHTGATGLTTFTSWTMGATGHSNVATAVPLCSSCHDTAASVPTTVVKKPAMGMGPTSHITYASGDCTQCHKTTTTFTGWLPADVHAAVTAAACSSCHSPTTATFYNVLSLVTFPASGHTFGSSTSDCATCHTKTSFLGATNGHDLTTTGISNAAKNCATSSCHSTSGFGKVFTSAHIPSSTPGAVINSGGIGQCDNCHTASYTSLSFTGAVISHTPGTAYSSATKCSNCHSGTYAATEGVKSLPATGHIPYTLGTSLDCNSCHKTTTSFTGWLTSDVHTAVNAGTSPYTCASCHDSSKTYTAVVIKPSAATAHISYNTGVDCSVCHTGATGLTTFTSWTMGTTGHSNVATAVPLCSSCHDTLATAPASVVKKPATGVGATFHLAYPSGDCTQCHKTTATFTGWLATDVHAAVTSAPCSSCHSPSGTTFYNVSLVSFPATGHSYAASTSNCSACHSTTTFLGATSGHDLTPTGIANAAKNCATSSCHSSSGFGKVFTSAHIPSSTPGAVITSGGIGQCDNCHTASYTSLSFNSAVISHAPGTAYPSAATCSGCHSGTYAATEGVKSLPATGHIPYTLGTSLDCNSCHKTTTSFTGWLTTDVHTAVKAGTSPYTCASCHDSNKTYTAVVIKPSAATAHISYNAGADCSVCHTGATGMTTFTSWTMGATGHTNVATAVPLCSSCHDTAASVPTSVVKKPLTGVGATNHIAYTSGDCTQCHKTTTTFTGWLTADVHAAVTAAACSSCHSPTNATFYNVALVTFPASGHSYAANTSDCGSCHSKTSFLGATNGHDMTATGVANATGNCTNAGCHVTGGAGKIFTTAHIPSSTPGATIAKAAAGQCDYCHTSAYTSLTFVTGMTMNHTQGYAASARCDSCHIATYAGEGVKTTAATSHISIPAGSDCAVCHKTTTSFTGWLPTDVHTAVKAGTSPYTCASCHDSSKTFTAVVIKPSAPTAHISYNTGVDCSVCHTGATGMTTFTSWTMGATGHSNVATAVPLCSSCHDTAASVPTSVVKKPAAGVGPTSHITYASGDCTQCHKTTTTFTGWLNADVHAAVTGATCSSCHSPSGTTFYNVSLVSFPATGHSYAASTSDCKSCHTTTTFLGATNGHDTSAAGITAATQNCASAGCHVTGGTPVGAGLVFTTTKHIPTSAAGFPVAKNGIGQCDNCHTASYTSLTFTGALMNHTSGTAYPAALKCSDCHSPAGAYASEGVKSLPATGHIPFGSSLCSACHNTTSFTGWTAATVHTVVGATLTGNTARCDSCHDSSKTYTGVVIKPTAANAHIAFNAGVDCNVCHTSLSTFTSWAKGATLHTNVATAVTQCLTCHDNGKTFPSVVVKPASPAHIPYNTGLDCSACHTDNTTFTVWNKGTTLHTSVTTGVPLCASCHDTTALAYPSVVKKSSSHISGYPTSEDCGFCHTSSNTGGYTSFLGMNMTGLPGHNGISTCLPCHNGTAAMGTSSFPGHVSIGISDCSGCHTPANTTNYTTFLGATSGHVGLATDVGNKNNCATTCHKTGGTGKVFTATHIPSSAPGVAVTGAAPGQCDYCHTASFGTMSFATATMVHTSGTAYPASLTCGGAGSTGCHNGSYTTEGNVAGAQAKTYISNHIPTTITGTLDCNTCHSSTPTISASGFNTGEKMNHNAASTGCVVCHLKGVTYMAAGITRISHNGASASKDCSSSGCHKPLGKTGKPYTSWN